MCWVKFDGVHLVNRYRRMLFSIDGKVLAILVVLLTGYGCVGANAAALVRVRAAKDLVCEEQQVRVEKTADGYYGASGCGRSASYHAVCESTQCAVVKRGEKPDLPRSQSVAPRRPDPFSSPP